MYMAHFVLKYLIAMNKWVPRQIVDHNRRDKQDHVGEIEGGG
jgi:hypothetical protein